MNKPEKHTSGIIDAEPLKLRAGALSLLFDNGMIRSVMFGGHEVVRRIYFALRDEYWNTVPYTVEDVRLDKRNGAFLLRFTARHEERDIRFSWEGVVEGHSDSSLRCSFTGTAHSTFKRNRIGWCVLHPLDFCQGTTCRIGKVDGSYAEAAFPQEEIAPWQPFTAMRSMEMAIDAKHTLALRFTGDEYETEDQRNWTDASFKTYSTRADLPIPVEVPNGTDMQQTVTASVSGNAAATEEDAKQIPHIDAALVSGNACSFPAVGVVCGTEVEGPNGCLPEEMCVSYVSMIADGDEKQQHERCVLLKKICQLIGCSAEVTVLLFHDSWQEQLSMLADILSDVGVPVRRYICLSAEEAVVPAAIADDCAAYLRGRFPDAGIVAGAKRYFVDVNRTRPEYTAVDGVCFAATPQVHTFDDRALLENAEGIGEVTRAIRNLYPERMVHIVPLTLRPRKQPEKPLKFGGPDPRQKQMFAAAWLFTSLCYGAVNGLASVTLEHCTGPAGLAASNGERYPVFHLLTSGIVSGKNIRVKMVRDHERYLVSMRFSLPEGEVLLIANCNSVEEKVLVTGLPKGCTVAVLNEDTAGEAQRGGDFWKSNQREIALEVSGAATVCLKPYALVRCMFPPEPPVQ